MKIIDSFIQNEILSNKDDLLVNAYDHASLKSMKKLLAFIKLIVLSDLNKYLELSSTSKKEKNKNIIRIFNRYKLNDIYSKCYYLKCFICFISKCFYLKESFNRDNDKLIAYFNILILFIYYLLVLVKYFF